MVPEYGDMSDDQLLNLIRSVPNDRRAFDELDRRYRFRLIALATRWFGPEMAKDLVQMALQRLWEKPPAADGSDVAAWLKKVMRNLGVDAIRRARPSAEISGSQEDPKIKIETLLMIREKLWSTLEFIAKGSHPPHKQLAFLLVHCLEMKPQEVVRDKSSRVLDFLLVDIRNALKPLGGADYGSTLNPLEERLDSAVGSFRGLLARHPPLAAFVNQRIGVTAFREYYLTEDRATDVHNWCNRIRADFV